MEFKQQKAKTHPRSFFLVALCSESRSPAVSHSLGSPSGSQPGPFSARPSGRRAVQPLAPRAVRSGDPCRVFPALRRGLCPAGSAGPARAAGPPGRDAGAAGTVRGERAPAPAMELSTAAPRARGAALLLPLFLLLWGKLFRLPCLILAQLLCINFGSNL